MFTGIAMKNMVTEILDSISGIFKKKDILFYTDSESKFFDLDDFIDQKQNIKTHYFFIYPPKDIKNTKKLTIFERIVYTALKDNIFQDLFFEGHDSRGENLFFGFASKQIKNTVSSLLLLETGRQPENILRYTKFSFHIYPTKDMAEYVYIHKDMMFSAPKEFMFSD